MSPSVAVGLLLDDARNLREVLVTDFHPKRKVRASCVGRVDVDEVDLALKFRQKRGKNVLLIAPDQPIAPPRVATLAKEVECPLALLRSLVDGLDGLERQGYADRTDSAAIGVVLPFPAQLRYERAVYVVAQMVAPAARPSGAWYRAV